MKSKPSHRELLRLLALQEQTKRNCVRIEDSAWDVADAAQRLQHTPLAAGFHEDIARIASVLRRAAHDLREVRKQAKRAHVEATGYESGVDE